MVSEAPGACSPSRSVVSKMRTGMSSVIEPRSSSRSRHACDRGSADACAWPACDLDRVEPRHLGAQLRADLLDLVVAVGLAQAAGTRAPPESISAIQLSAKTPVWMSVRTSFIVALTPSVDARAADVVAVLGGVADAEAHEVEAAAVHQVDDELELMHRLEVGELGLVAGLDERLEGRLDERRDAAAEERLLAEQVGLGLLGEGRLEDARTRGAEAPRRTPGRAPGPCPRRPARPRRAPARRRPRRRPSAAGGPDPWARPCRRPRSAAGTIRPNRMLKPWANISSCPARRLGAISAS